MIPRHGHLYGDPVDLGLSGRVAVVVGGTGYLGSAVADRLRAEGATVVTASRSGGDVRIDGTDPASVEAGFATVLREHGRVDVLVVAAAPPADSLDPSSLSDPDTVLDAVGGKAMTFLRLAQAVLPTMRAGGHGRVIAVSGQNAYLTGNVAGSVRNAALIVAAKNLADEHAGSGVTVNVVNPGTVVDDPSTEVEPARGGESSPAQIAALIVFLASADAAAISGESISMGHKLRGIATT
jgi:NAD(P)-dependent dehydrogenase (short-subunit alcohol dehydrogenase family)